MALFLNEMRFHPRVQASARDSRIIRSLMDFFKYQRRLYKGLAEQSLTTEQEQKLRQKDEKTAEDVNDAHCGNDDLKAAEVERLSVVAAIQRSWDAFANKSITSDLPSTTQHSTPVKGRHRASTLAGTTLRSMVEESQGNFMDSKPPLSKEARSQSMLRQMSEGRAVMTRERRQSTSSIRSNKSGNTWSTIMTMGISKLRQKSEDIYQHLVHPINALGKADNRSCVCWTPAYTGINEHHVLNTARSHPNLRPSVVVTNAFQDSAQSQSSVAHTTPGVASNKSVKRLKSSINLGRSTPATAPSPTSSPTRNQFSSISSRHSRSNSNSSMGYHPNPDCPYHIPCLNASSKDTSKKPSEPMDENSIATLQEALQDDFIDMIPQLQVSRMTSLIPPPSPAWQCSPWYTSSQQNNASTVSPVYKPFILFYRSQMVAQQLCLLEQHFLEQIRWDELLEMELTKAGRRNGSKAQSSFSGYLFKVELERSGIEASNQRSNMLCMWVASEVVSTHPIEDRVHVIEKFIRIAQKCYQYRNFNSLIQLVMGLGSSHLCGLRRTWSRVGNYEMRVLQDLQDFISPCSNWRVIRKAMNQVSYKDTLGDSNQRFNFQTQDSAVSAGSVSGMNLTMLWVHKRTLFLCNIQGMV
ncbi:ras guanine nucleotide exchange factor domain-containing protein [Gamsiella multidivaricata]|uniref:ras guanine nucleotide exchange factor domain-containing protein n=1 Tax=Gamsiella multidivaricata TaxID=101098 RepID=UPI0022209123|nr:ras guanine nucleotide exchange factor domain-containing protein [Gamsiella multidivaricata]KAI7832611.1 ras guanine nucleotide exchange factor domain-containing protein [Gamsiella multidivaricata]